MGKYHGSEQFIQVSTVVTEERMTFSTKLLTADRRLRGVPGKGISDLKHSPQFTLFTRIKTTCLRYETVLKS